MRRSLMSNYPSDSCSSCQSMMCASHAMGQVVHNVACIDWVESLLSGIRAVCVYRIDNAFTNCCVSSTFHFAPPQSNNCQGLYKTLASLYRQMRQHVPNTNAMFFILPSVSLFFQFTPFSSKRAQAASRSSTAMQI